MDLHFEYIHKPTISMIKIVLLCGFSLGYKGRIHERGVMQEGQRTSGLTTVLCHFFELYICEGIIDCDVFTMKSTGYINGNDSKKERKLFLPF